MNDPVDTVGVHAAHCCDKCGCRYGDENCPVATGVVAPKYVCEDCEGRRREMVDMLRSLTENELGLLLNEANENNRPSPATLFRVIEWFATGETGASSKALAARLCGVMGAGKSHPLDPADFNRCLLLLVAVPEFLPRLQEVRNLSPFWAALVDRWEDVESSFIAEVGLGWSKNYPARRTSRLMENIYAPVYKAQNHHFAALSFL